MKITPRVFESKERLGEELAAQLLGVIRKAGGESRNFLLGCPGGRSLKATYNALGAMAAREQSDLSRLVLVMMDEYVFKNGSGYVNCDPGAHYSCHRFAEEEIRGVLNEGLPKVLRVPQTNVWFPDPADPAAYDGRIEQAGGVDVFLAASGATDGHVAFNGPGSLLDSRSRVVQLSDETRRDNMGTFPGFSLLDEVPAHGVTVGLGSILGFSRKTVMVISGSHKVPAAERLLKAGGFRPDWPATFVYEADDAEVLLDRAAAFDKEN